MTLKIKNLIKSLYEMRTFLLLGCSYAPYVLCSVFAGALSDRWDKKKTMLAVLGAAVCLIARRDKHIWRLESHPESEK